MPFDTPRGAFWVPTNDLIKKSSTSQLEEMINHLNDSMCWIQYTYGVKGEAHITRAQWAVTKCTAMISISKTVNNL